MEYILITGKNIYICNNFKQLSSQFLKRIERVVRKAIMFAYYVSVLRIARPEYIKEIEENTKNNYEINQEQALMAARKVKKVGVNFFLFIKLILFNYLIIKSINYRIIDNKIIGYERNIEVTYIA